MDENAERIDTEQEIEENEPEQGKPPKGKKRALKEIREWVVSLAVALLVVFVLRSFVFTIIRVDGASMQPTLQNNERLFVTVFDTKFSGADRGEVVICNYPGRYTDHLLGIKTKTYFVKRVVATPGDTVWRESGVTYVTYADSTDTVALDAQFAARSFGDDYTYTLKDDEYFVVGDNRGNSRDSRNWNDATPSDDVGPITGDMILGQVRFVLWPLSDARGVE